MCAWLDDNLLQCIDDALEDDLANSQHRPFLEAIRLEVSQQIHESAPDYLPLSHNPLFNLLGLYAEDYVNREEMCHISDSPLFRARLKSEHALGLLDLLSMLDTYLSSGLAAQMSPMPTHVQSISDIASAACELLAIIGNDQALILAQDYELGIRGASSGPQRIPYQRSPPVGTYQAIPATEFSSQQAPTSPAPSNKSSGKSHRITRRLFTAADKVCLEELDLSPDVYPWVSVGHSIASFHSHGLLHGDISDSNVIFQPLTGAAIMIDPSGHADDMDLYIDPERMAGEFVAASSGIARQALMAFLSGYVTTSRLVIDPTYPGFTDDLLASLGGQIVSESRPSAPVITADECDQLLGPVVSRTHSEVVPASDDWAVERREIPNNLAAIGLCALLVAGVDCSGNPGHCGSDTGYCCEPVRAGVRQSNIFASAQRHIRGRANPQGDRLARAATRRSAGSVAFP